MCYINIVKEMLHALPLDKTSISYLFYLIIILY